MVLKSFSKLPILNRAIRDLGAVIAELVEEKIREADERRAKINAFFDRIAEARRRAQEGK